MRIEVAMPTERAIIDKLDQLRIEQAVADGLSKAGVPWVKVTARLRE